MPFPTDPSDYWNRLTSFASHRLPVGGPDTQKQSHNHKRPVDQTVTSVKENPFKRLSNPLEYVREKIREKNISYLYQAVSPYFERLRQLLNMPKKEEKEGGQGKRDEGSLQQDAFSSNSKQDGERRQGAKKEQEATVHAPTAVTTATAHAQAVSFLLNILPISSQAGNQKDRVARSPTVPDSAFMKKLQLMRIEVDRSVDDIAEDAYFRALMGSGSNSGSPLDEWIMSEFFSPQHLSERKAGQLATSLAALPEKLGFNNTFALVLYGYKLTSTLQEECQEASQKDNLQRAASLFATKLCELSCDPRYKDIKLTALQFKLEQVAPSLITELEENQRQTERWASYTRTALMALGTLGTALSIAGGIYYLSTKPTIEAQQTPNKPFRIFNFEPKSGEIPYVEIGLGILVGGFLTYLGWKRCANMLLESRVSATTLSNSSSSTQQPKTSSSPNSTPFTNPNPSTLTQQPQTSPFKPPPFTTPDSSSSEQTQTGPSPTPPPSTNPNPSSSSQKIKTISSNPPPSTTKVEKQDLSPKLEKKIMNLTPEFNQLTEEAQRGIKEDSLSTIQRITRHEKEHVDRYGFNNLNGYDDPNKSLYDQLQQFEKEVVRIKTKEALAKLYERLREGTLPVNKVDSKPAQQQLQVEPVQPPTSDQDTGAVITDEAARNQAMQDKVKEALKPLQDFLKLLHDLIVGKRSFIKPPMPAKKEKQSETSRKSTPKTSNLNKTNPPLPPPRGRSQSSAPQPGKGNLSFGHNPSFSHLDSTSSTHSTTASSSSNSDDNPIEEPENEVEEGSQKNSPLMGTAPPVKRALAGIAEDLRTFIKDIETGIEKEKLSNQFQTIYTKLLEPIAKFAYGELQDEPSIFSLFNNREPDLNKITLFHDAIQKAKTEYKKLVNPVKTNTVSVPPSDQGELQSSLTKIRRSLVNSPNDAHQQSLQEMKDGLRDCIEKSIKSLPGFYTESVLYLKANPKDTALKEKIYTSLINANDLISYYLLNFELKKPDERDVKDWQLDLESLKKVSSKEDFVSLFTELFDPVINLLQIIEKENEPSKTLNNLLTKHAYYKALKTRACFVHNNAPALFGTKQLAFNDSKSATKQQAPFLLEELIKIYNGAVKSIVELPNSMNKIYRFGSIDVAIASDVKNIRENINELKDKICNMLPSWQEQLKSVGKVASREDFDRLFNEFFDPVINLLDLIENFKKNITDSDSKGEDFVSLLNNFFNPIINLLEGKTLGDLLMKHSNYKLLKTRALFEYNDDPELFGSQQEKKQELLAKLIKIYYDTIKSIAKLPASITSNIDLDRILDVQQVRNKINELKNKIYKLLPSSDAPQANPSIFTLFGKGFLSMRLNEPPSPQTLPSEHNPKELKRGDSFTDPITPQTSPTKFINLKDSFSDPPAPNDNLLALAGPRGEGTFSITTGSTSVVSQEESGPISTSTENQAENDQ